MILTGQFVGTATADGEVRCYYWILHVENAEMLIIVGSRCVRIL
jgi:hypothetical protein